VARKEEAAPPIPPPDPLRALWILRVGRRAPTAMTATLRRPGHHALRWGWPSSRDAEAEKVTDRAAVFYAIGL